MPNGIYTSLATGKEMRSMGFVLWAKSERGEAGDEATDGNGLIRIVRQIRIILSERDPNRTTTRG